MRWTAALALMAAIGAGSAGAAGTAQRPSYWHATAHADFWYTIDYGSHPDATFNGEYTAHLRYSVRTIVSFNGRRISTVAPPIVDGSALVVNKMTAWTQSGPRPRVQCEKSPTHDTDGARRTSGAQVSVGGGSAHIDPGSAIVWPVGCAATESLAYHGLPDGKTITGGASARGFRGGIGCSDTYEHQRDPINLNSHSFYGTATFSIKFSPLGKTKLADARRALRRGIGRDIRWRPLSPGRLADCLDPG